MAAGWIYEVFSSIQGEGIFCGQRHIFVRFAGCNLACNYCDTPASRTLRTPECTAIAGSRASDCLRIPNPVLAGEITRICRSLPGRTVSLTGGEPLLQPDFAAELAGMLKDANFIVHLETNGTLADALADLAKSIDVIAMDMKLPSACGHEMWDSHELFLERALSMSAFVFVKVIVGPETREDEIAYCADMIASANRSVPLVIQPVTGDSRVPSHLLLKLQEVALRKIEDVRVIPQCHKLLGIP
ncbi:MAG: 7-carboxy-7-deazaguanine synthase QueE [Armatimonadota bacterium]